MDCKKIVKDIERFALKIDEDNKIDFEYTIEYVDTLGSVEKTISNNKLVFTINVCKDMNLIPMLTLTDYETEKLFVKTTLGEEHMTEGLYVYFALEQFMKVWHTLYSYSNEEDNNRLDKFNKTCKIIIEDVGLDYIEFSSEYLYASAYTMLAYTAVYDSLLLLQLVPTRKHIKYEERERTMEPVTLKTLKNYIGRSYGEDLEIKEVEVSEHIMTTVKGYIESYASEACLTSEVCTRAFSVLYNCVTADTGTLFAQLYKCIDSLECLYEIGYDWTEPLVLYYTLKHLNVFIPLYVNYLNNLDK